MVSFKYVSYTQNLILSRIKQFRLGIGATVNKPANFT